MSKAAFEKTLESLKKWKSEHFHEADPAVKKAVDSAIELVSDYLSQKSTLREELEEIQKFVSPNSNL